MKEFLRKMLSENSEVSEMRVSAFICTIAAVSVAIYGMSKPPIDYQGLSILCGTFLGTSMAGKVSQKFAERKKDDT